MNNQHIPRVKTLQFCYHPLFYYELYFYANEKKMKIEE